MRRWFLLALSRILSRLRELDRGAWYGGKSLRTGNVFHSSSWSGVVSVTLYLKDDDFEAYFISWNVIYETLNSQFRPELSGQFLQRCPRLSWGGVLCWSDWQCRVACCSPTVISFHIGCTPSCKWNQDPPFEMRDCSFPSCTLCSVSEGPLGTVSTLEGTRKLAHCG